MRELLAPAGKLRIGVYIGSPLSMVQDPRTGQAHGLSLDLGKELARRLGVPAEPVVYQRMAEVLGAIKAGDVDFTISNATPVRALDAAFSQTLLSLELGYLVPAHSPIADISDIGKSGIRVGIARGSTSERTLPEILPNASLVATQDLQQAIQMLTRRELDAFATNKPILFEMSDRIPGSQVLEGRWGLEHLAIAIPKGRDSGMAFVRKFVEEARSGSLLAQAAQRAGVRGAVSTE